MSSEQRPWWLPNPSQRFAPGRPGLGWFGGCMVALLLAWPLLALIALVVGPDMDGKWRMGLAPLGEAAGSRHFLATVAIAGLAGLASWCCARLLWCGNKRGDLWRAVFCVWLILPGQATAFSLLHWFMLWQGNIGIYDVWLRLQGIGNAALLATMASAYLLLSRRLRQRFSSPADLVAVF